MFSELKNRAQDPRKIMTSATMSYLNNTVSAFVAFLKAGNILVNTHNSMPKIITHPAAVFMPRYEIAKKINTGYRILNILITIMITSKKL